VVGECDVDFAANFGEGDEIFGGRGGVFCGEAVVSCMSARGLGVFNG